MQLAIVSQEHERQYNPGACHQNSGASGLDLFVDLWLMLAQYAGNVSIKTRTNEHNWQKVHMSKAHS